MALRDFFLGGKQNEKKESSRDTGVNQLNKGDFTGKAAGFASSAPECRVPEYSEPRGPRYYVLRECMTGVTEYGYFCDGRQLGAAAVDSIPGFPVRLQCEGLNLYSEFDKTVFPGVTREIMDQSTGRVYAVVTGFGDGTHTLQTPEGSFVVKTGPGLWHFLRDGVMIANLTNGNNPGAQLTMTAREALPDSLALLMMSFPLVQIYR